MKKYILFIALIHMICLGLSGKEYQAANDTVKQDLRPDSTIVCLLDNKIIPYKSAIQKATSGEIIWVTGASIPREAIRYFGVAGKKGLYVFETRKEEKGKGNEK